MNNKKIGRVYVSLKRAQIKPFGRNVSFRQQALEYQLKLGLYAELKPN